MSSKTEVESPVLQRQRGLGPTYYSVHRYLAWVCEYELGKLFELENADSICFVAKARSDRSTYKIELENMHFRYPSLLKPIETDLFFLLAEWLKAQIIAGRPHIGVRIIK